MPDPAPAYSASSYFNDLHKLTDAEKVQLDNWLENLKQTKNKPDEHAECLDAIECYLREQPAATQVKFFKQSPDLLDLIRNNYGLAWHDSDIAEIRQSWPAFYFTRFQSAYINPQLMFVQDVLFYITEYVKLCRSGSEKEQVEIVDYTQQNYGFDVRFFLDRNILLPATNHEEHINEEHINSAPAG